MTTLRIQFEGESGVLSILTKRELESSESLNSRYVEKRNELEGVAVRAKVMGVSITGEVSHETISL